VFFSQGGPRPRRNPREFFAVLDDFSHFLGFGFAGPRARGLLAGPLELLLKELVVGGVLAELMTRQSLAVAIMKWSDSGQPLDKRLGSVEEQWHWGPLALSALHNRPAFHFQHGHGHGKVSQKLLAQNVRTV
jgi:hypothetical protein